MQTIPIIVIGSGLAGYNLIKEFRKLDKDSPILLISQDDAHSYSKPMLSTALTKGKLADDLSIADPGKMAEQLNISVRNHTHVDAIDVAAKQILIGNETLAYRQLVLATGAKANKLNFPGSEHEKVVSINDLVDYRNFRHLLDGKKHVLIMGAGLIGCEYANDLLNGNYEVTVVDPSNAALSGLIPEEAGQALISGLSDAGAKFHMQRYVSQITEDDNTLTAQLDDGSSINCDLVISAVGLKPAIQLAKSAGIDCAQGIVCDQYLRTSQPDIYALGDCAEIDGNVRLYVLPLMASARALAKTLNGSDTAVVFSAMPVATKTPACPVVVCPPTFTEGAWVFEQNELDICGRFIDSDNKLNGFVLTGQRCVEKQALVKELNSL
jgi:rubredoxin---NAD+ reductase